MMDSTIIMYRPHRLDISFAILFLSIVFEIVFLILVFYPKRKGTTALVITVANLVSTCASELFFRIRYGDWFISVYYDGIQNLCIRLVCSMVIVMAGGILFLKKYYPNQKRFVVVLALLVAAAAALSLAVVVVAGYSRYWNWQ